LAPERHRERRERELLGRVVHHDQVPHPRGRRAAGCIRCVEHEHPVAVAGQLPRARGTDDPGADDDHVRQRIHDSLAVLAPPSSPRAGSVATLAGVPVPHGERSYSPPEQSTKLRQSACPDGAEISMWATTPPPPPSPPTRESPAASSASCTACVKRVSSFTRE